MQRMMAEGASPERILEELFSLVRNLWLVVRWPDILDSLDVSEQERGYLESESPHWPEAVLRGLMSRLVSLIGQSRMGLRSDVLIGLLMLEAARAAAPDAEPERPAVPVPPSPMSRKEGEMPAAMPKPVSPAPVEPTAPKEPALPASEPSALPEESGPPVPAGGEGAEALPQADWAPLPQETCEELLALAHHRDFVLFCALLDGEFLGSEG